MTLPAEVGDIFFLVIGAYKGKPTREETLTLFFSVK